MFGGCCGHTHTPTPIDACMNLRRGDWTARSIVPWIFSPKMNALHEGNYRTCTAQLIAYSENKIKTVFFSSEARAIFFSYVSMPAECCIELTNETGIWKVFCLLNLWRNTHTYNVTTFAGGRSKYIICKYTYAHMHHKNAYTVHTLIACIVSNIILMVVWWKLFVDLFQTIHSLSPSQFSFLPLHLVILRKIRILCHFGSYGNDYT